MTDEYRFGLTRADGSSVDVAFSKEQDSYAIDDVVAGFRDFLAGCGYLEKTINEALGGAVMTDAEVVQRARAIVREGA